MIHQNVKDFYYLLLLPGSKLVRPFYRWHYKLFLNSRRELQIGCGPNYLPGFINIDGNLKRKAEYTMDVRAGLPLPDESMRFIYSCHMLEHLHVNEAIQLLKECRRVLVTSGYMRLTLPDFRFALKILDQRARSAFPRSFECPEGQAINFLFCDGQHKFAYSASVIEELAMNAGFSKVSPTTNGDRHIDGLSQIEPGGSFSVNIYK